MESNREQRLIDSGSAIDKLLGGFKDRLGEGREDYRQALYATRELAGQDPEAARIQQTFATNPTFVTARDLMGISDPGYRKQREARGMGLSQDPLIKTGQVIGTLGNDIVNDSTRGLWWLLNAPQAVANVVNEYGYAKANPPCKLTVPLSNTFSFRTFFRYQVICYSCFIRLTVLSCLINVFEFFRY